MRPEDFGTEKFALRCSTLHTVLECPLSAYLQMVDERSESGAAANTGNLIHFAARMYHSKAAGDARLALGLMQLHHADGAYALGDLDLAARHFHGYASDPRNQTAKVILNEEQIRFTLPPALEDKTQAPIHIIGTLDQVREIEGILTLVDLKTGVSLWGKVMLNYHAMQLAAYMLGATEKLGRRVERALIIRTADYVQSTPGPAFWWASWGLAQAPTILSGIPRVVAQIRNGNVWPMPGGACRFCPEGGVQNCVPKLLSLSSVK